MKDNQKKLYDHFVKTGQVERAEAIDKSFNFSGEEKLAKEESARIAKEKAAKEKAAKEKANAQ